MGKLYSILIQDLDSSGRILGYSKSSYKPGLRPTVKSWNELCSLVSKRLKEHKSQFKNCKSFCVTTSTSDGKFMSTYNRSDISKLKV